MSNFILMGVSKSQKIFVLDVVGTKVYYTPFRHKAKRFSLSIAKKYCKSLPVQMVMVERK